MSLRVFHIIFITASVLLSLYVVVWGLRSFLADGRSSSLILGAVFLMSALALAEYGRRVFRKLRDLP